MTITPFAGTTFWIITIAFILAGFLFRPGVVPSWATNCFMISISLFVLSLAVNHAQVLLPLLFLLIILVFFSGNYLLANEKSKLILIYVIAVIIFIFSYFKYSLVQDIINTLSADLTSSHITSNHIFFIGVSYFSFKFIHFLTECYKNKITNLNLLTFINYILFFPSFFSGPINRYNSFADNILTPSPSITENKLTGLKRVINGLFKKIVIGDFLFPYSIAALDVTHAATSDIIIGIYAYMLYIYFNFSGYTDMAIGCGKMVGIELPENFNYPFFKRNLQLFWANWHISLTSWLTDYIYWPLARKFRHVRILKKRPVTTSNICIVLTFLICGLWHGDGLNYILWGLYHGTGLALLNCYTYLVKKYSPKDAKKFIRKSPFAYALSNIITFQFVAFGFLLFACDIEELKQVASIFL